MSNTSLEERIRTRAAGGSVKELETRLDDVVQWFSQHADEHMSPERFVAFATKVFLNLIDLHLMAALAMGEDQAKKAHERFSGLLLPVGRNIVVKERRAG